jgi:hypothetical protein
LTQQPRRIFPPAVISKPLAASEAVLRYAATMNVTNERRQPLREFVAVAQRVRLEQTCNRLK